MSDSLAFNINLEKYRNIVNNGCFIRYEGKVTQVVGLTIESCGPAVNIGELCYIQTNNDTNIMAEVVGFKENKVLLMPLGDMNGIGPGSIVISTGHTLRVAVGEGLLGRVIDGLGNPLDGKGPLEFKKFYPVNNAPPAPLVRKRITTPLSLGIKAIDGLLTIGKGQRIGIFAGSGVGKSTMMGMIARNSLADINVIALIGERGREVREFIERDLKEEGLQRSIIVVATSDQPALVRLKGALVATAISEYFRDKGMDVLLLMDSLTRFAMAQREIGLAIGEPPVSRGYTPSVFALLPKLLERAGNAEHGSITGLYTVLVDGDDLSEPVTDTARGILDGHIVLSRSLANKNHYPAIDVLASVSRVMGDIVTKEQKQLANQITKILAIYKDAEDLINIGAYVKGSNESIDYAIEHIDNINSFLVQDVNDHYSFEDVLREMQEVFI
ncbi:MAG: flagellum-specific synthase [Clostridiales bacterium]|jgi:flagellum-specific ATP synthase|nr:flagellum-specific synthase [Clostridiales bacterium]MDK2932282.1 flagellum-specific synthase [Clostridiales bacterium]